MPAIEAGLSSREGMAKGMTEVAGGLVSDLEKLDR